MKTLFLILLFSKVVLLTPEPITVNGKYELVLKDPIEAITSGAGIQIDVSSQISWDGDDILDFRKQLSEKYPPGTITAELVSTSGERVVLTYTGYTAFNDESARLLLNAEPGMPINVEFDKLIVQTSIELEAIKIFWKNYRS